MQEQLLTDIRSLITSGMSEREVAAELGIDRYHVRKTLGRLPRQRAAIRRAERKSQAQTQAPSREYFLNSENYTSPVQAQVKSQAGIPDEPDEHDAAGNTGVFIQGVTPGEGTSDINALWSAVIHASRHTAELQRKKREQRIILPNEPVAIAFLSDMHFGSLSVDYASAKRDAEIIRKTPGMYAILHGDLHDNWIVQKLQALQRTQAIPLDGEMMLYTDYLKILDSKLLVMVGGNHDNWTYKLAGIDPFTHLLKDTLLLYDRNQVVFTLEQGKTKRVIMVRHKWRYNSVYNPVHGMMVGWQRGDIDFDVAVGGHTHIGTFCTAFWGHGKKRYAVLTGTYKNFGDSFGEEIGVPAAKDSGCGAMVMLPDGRIFFTEDLQTAADFLAFVRRGTPAV